MFTIWNKFLLQQRKAKSWQLDEKVFFNNLQLTLGSAGRNTSSELRKEGPIQRQRIKNFLCQVPTISRNKPISSKSKPWLHLPSTPFQALMRNSSVILSSPVMQKKFPRIGFRWQKTVDCLNPRNTRFQRVRQRVTTARQVSTATMDRPGGTFWTYVGRLPRKGGTVCGSFNWGPWTILRMTRSLKASDRNHPPFLTSKIGTFYPLHPRRV